MTANLLMLAGLVTAMLAALAGLGKAGVATLRFIRRLAQFVDDWMGEPKREGVPDERRRRGVLERLDTLTAEIAAGRIDTAAELAALRERVTAIEAQLTANGGGSLRDVVERIASPDGAAVAPIGASSTSTNG